MTVQRWKAKNTKIDKKTSKTIAMEIAAFCDKYRPQLIGTYDENGKQVKVYQKSWASGTEPQKVR